MKRPFIYIHMLTSLDGKIWGEFTKLPEEEAAAPFFKQIGFTNAVWYTEANLSGTNTALNDYTYHKEPDLDKTAKPVPEGDFIANASPERYSFVLDRNGILGFQKNEIFYAGVHSHIVDVITEKASNEYKDFLRRKKISYVICGKDDIDFDILFDKMVTEFGVKTLAVAGGGTLNWNFLRKGYVDEVGFVVVPGADGGTTTPQLFMAKEGLGEQIPVSFEFIEAKPDRNSGAVWLHYKVKKVWQKDEWIKEYGLGPKDFVAADNSGK
ncbi:MAG: dihydrofolate reductase family protein [Treponema sp.]|nr:dihydrofolate reductase family protein [Treponema sp.]